MTVRKAPKRGWDSTITSLVEQSFEEDITKTPYAIRQKLLCDSRGNPEALSLVPSLKSLQNKKYRIETDIESQLAIRVEHFKHPYALGERWGGEFEGAWFWGKPSRKN
jgi:hypothetical protein